MSVVSTTNAQLVDITACRDIADSMARFACYEALEAPQISTETTVIKEPQQPVKDSAVQSAPKVSEKNVEVAAESADSREETADVADFGSQQYRARITEDADGREALVDTVTDIKRIRKNQLDVTLSSGQVWRQMISKRFDLRKGDEVSIVPLRMGEYYRLSSERSRGFIQVGRLK